jgi:hypothetical protein
MEIQRMAWSDQTRRKRASVRNEKYFLSRFVKMPLHGARGCTNDNAPTEAGALSK